MSGSIDSRSSDGGNDEAGSGDDRSAPCLKRSRASTFSATGGVPNKQHESHESLSRMESPENKKKMRFSMDNPMEATSSSFRDQFLLCPEDLLRDPPVSQPVSVLPRPKLLPMACYRRSAEKPLAQLLPYPPETKPTTLVGSELLRSEASGASSSDDEDDESSEIDEQQGAAATPLALRNQQRLLRELMTREHNLVTPAAHHPVPSPDSPEAVPAVPLQDDHDHQQQSNPYSSSEGWLLNGDGRPPQWDYLLQQQQQQQVMWNDNDVHSSASSGSFSAIGNDLETTFQHF